MQIAGVTPHYTTHPIFPNLFTAMIVASLIAIGLNFVFGMLRKKTTDIEKMSKVIIEFELRQNISIFHWIHRIYTVV
jgi:hypothetical protein